MFTTYRQWQSTYFGEMVLEFHPNKKVCCEEVVFIQLAVAHYAGAPYRGGLLAMFRITAEDIRKAKGGAGPTPDELRWETGFINYPWHKASTVPYYGYITENRFDAGLTRPGKRIGEQVRPAWMQDRPEIIQPDDTKDASQTFLTCVFCKKGPDKGKYYECVKWGWEFSRRTQRHAMIPPALVKEPGATHSAAMAKFATVKDWDPTKVVRKDSPFKNKKRPR